MPTPTILLIRADDATHRALWRALERSGCQVAEARTQDEAVRMAAELAPDLVVQEETVPSPERPGAFDEVVSAVRVLAAS